jgi:hypothetical protein
MFKFLKDRRNFNTPVTVTRDTVVNQIDPVPPTQPEPKVEMVAPEEIIPEPIQEKTPIEVKKPKSTRKKKTDEGY